MSQELLYTSAPRGLRPGSSGFCTVVSTQGMAINLADRLESLSGYRHVYQPQDSNAHRNPVVYAHIQLSVGRQPYHVLSRIAAAGVDYTQRTNKLAHHLVLQPAELPPAGPAWVLSPQQGLMDTQWDGQTRVLPAGRDIPRVEDAPGICEAWRQIAGDAGWGGVLAATALAEPAKQAVLIFRAGQDLLPLIAESLAVLPYHLRWKTTFSTYFTKLPVGVDCQWRCLLEGSPEVANLRRTPQLLVLDVRSPLGPAPAGMLVEAARTGVLPAAAAAPSKPARTPKSFQATDEELEQYLPPAAVDSAMQPGGVSTDTSPQAVRATPPPLASPDVEAPPLPRSAGRAYRRKKSRFTLFTGIAAAILLLVIVPASVYLSRPRVPAVPQHSQTTENGATSDTTSDVVSAKSSEGKLTASPQHGSHATSEKTIPAPQSLPNSSDTVPIALKDIEKTVSNAKTSAETARTCATATAELVTKAANAVGKRSDGITGCLETAAQTAGKAKDAAEQATKDRVRVTEQAEKVNNNLKATTEEKGKARHFVEQVSEHENVAKQAQVESETNTQKIKNLRVLADLPQSTDITIPDRISPLEGNKVISPSQLASGDWSFLKEKQTEVQFSCFVTPTQDSQATSKWYCDFVPNKAESHHLGVARPVPHAPTEKTPMASLVGRPAGLSLVWITESFTNPSLAAIKATGLKYGNITIRYERATRHLCLVTPLQQEAVPIGNLLPKPLTVLLADKVPPPEDTSTLQFVVRRITATCDSSTIFSAEPPAQPARNVEPYIIDHSAPLSLKLTNGVIVTLQLRLPDPRTQSIRLSVDYSATPLIGQGIQDIRPLLDIARNDKKYNGCMFKDTSRLQIDAVKKAHGHVSAKVRNGETQGQGSIVKPTVSSDELKKYKAAKAEIDKIENALKLLQGGMQIEGELYLAREGGPQLVLVRCGQKKAISTK